MKDLKTKIIDKSFNFEDDDGTFKSSTIFLKDLFEIPEIRQLLIHSVSNSLPPAKEVYENCDTMHFEDFQEWYEDYGQ